jgi:hypothetical protein
VSRSQINLPRRVGEVEYDADLFRDVVENHVVAGAEADVAVPHCRTDVLTVESAR